MRSTLASILVAALCVFVASPIGCSVFGSNNNPGSGDGGLSFDDSADGGSSSSSSNGDLNIVSLTSTVAQITSAASIATGKNGSAASSTTLVAIITDSSGLNTIAGGQVLDANGATYAAFGAGADKGTYSADVSWDAITQAAPINFGEGGSKITLTAKFFDNAGNTATSTVDLSLYCSPQASGGACDGTCFDFGSDSSNCGKCGNACGTDLACIGGSCKPPQLSTCESLTTATSCTQVCAALGVQCLATCGSEHNVSGESYVTCGATTSRTYLDSCDSEGMAGEGLQCCCAN
jgi:hypothetical protein